MTLIAPSPSPPAALAHSVVATGLADADRLRAWRADPARLGELGVDPSTVDLGSLADFAGLSEKIRHNPCRDDLQLTFRLLLVSGLEIELFRDYAPRSLERRRQGLNSVADRLEGLLQFVEGWASETDQVRCLLRDVLRHEHVVAILRAAEVGVFRTADASKPGGPAIPLYNGYLLVRRMTCDPRQVGRVLRAREPDLGQIERGSWTFGYHKSTEGRLRMLEVDHGVGDLILAVDGRTSADGIAERLFGDGPAAGSLLAAFDQLTELGLLVWRPGGGRRAMLETCG